HTGEERLVFLHSWNEWCEGTYIEPDGRNGRKYLEETRDGVSEAIRIIQGAREAGLDLDVTSLVNWIGRGREEAYRMMLDSMSREAHTLRTELEAARGDLLAMQ